MSELSASRYLFWTVCLVCLLLSARNRLSVRGEPREGLVLLHESRQAFRSVSRSRRPAAAAVVVLACAVGGAGGLFSLFNTVTLRELPVRAPERLVAFYPAEGQALYGIRMATLAEVARSQRVFDDICGVARGSYFRVEIDGMTSRRPAEAHTGACYRMLGVRPFLGRLLDERDAPIVGDRASVAVISHKFWRTIGSRGDVVGQTLRIEGNPLTIVGVTPASYGGLNADEPPDITLPLGINTHLRGGTNVVVALHAIGRLKEGVTIAEAAAHLRGIWPALWTATNPTSAGQRLSRAAAPDSLRVESIAAGFSELRPRYRQALRILLALGVLLLILACVNVGALMLARSVAREPELRLRACLGASRGRLTLQLVIEGLIQAVCAACLAVPIAWWVSHVIAATVWTGPLPLTMDVAPDRRVLVTIAATGVMTGILVSVPSVLTSVRMLSSAAVDRQSTFVATARWRHGLVLSQVSVSLILTFGAVAFVRNVLNLRQLEPGYSVQDLYFARLQNAPTRPRQEEPRQYLSAVLEKVAAIPNVRSSTLSLSFPTTDLRQVTSLTRFAREDESPGTIEASGLVERVWPGFFQATGIPLVSGRDFAMDDDSGHPDVAIINAPLAALLFQESVALGKRIRVGSKQEAVIVIGVARAASPGDPRISNLPMIYRPLLQESQFAGSPMLLVRATEASDFPATLRRTVEALGRHEVAFVRTFEYQIDLFLLKERLLSRLSFGFAAVGLLLAALGLYALLAYTVERRTKEFGLRLALGAPRSLLVRALLRETAIVTTAGLALGAMITPALSRLAQSLLLEPTGFDAGSLLVAAVTILAISLVATAIPCYRSIHILPAAALRQE